MSTTKTNVKEIGIEIIRDYMGETTAQLYEKFYQKLDKTEVVVSVRELLVEYMGDVPAQKVLKEKGL
jgi:hypothetical protein